MLSGEHQGFGKSWKLAFCYLSVSRCIIYLWLSGKENNTMKVITFNSYTNLSSLVKFACQSVSWKYSPCHTTYKIRIYESVTVFFRWMAEELECFWFLVKIFQASFVEDLVEGKFEGEQSMQHMRLNTDCIQGGWAWLGYLFWSSIRVKRSRKQQRRY